MRLARAFQSVTALIVTTLLVTGACFAAVLGHYEPTINSLLAGRSGVDQTFDGMLDEETGLRGYIATGSQTLLAPYYLGQREIAAGENGVGSLASRSDLAVPIVNMRVDQDKWLSGWAAPALARSGLW